MKRFFSYVLQSVLLCVFSFCVLSCEKEESDDFEDVTIGNNSSNNSSVAKPAFDKYLTTTDTDGFSLRLRFKNGGDVRENMSCTVYWKAYSQKPSSTPAERDLTNSESMRIYAHTKTKTTFDKSHAGYNGGTYIYYYAKCKNSKGSCKTAVTYTIVKR